MKSVYMLQIDWANDNKGGIYTTLFERYEDALDLFNEEIHRMGEGEGFIVFEDYNLSDKTQPWKAIVLFPDNELLDENDNRNEQYEIIANYEDNPDNPKLSYHIQDKDNYGYHLFFNLTKIEIMEEQK